MITKIAYRPYASGANGTQIQQKKINFGISKNDARIVQAFAEKLAHAMDAPNDMAKVPRLTEAFGVLKGISPDVTVASIIEPLKTASIDAILK